MYLIDDGRCCLLIVTRFWFLLVKPSKSGWIWSRDVQICRTKRLVFDIFLQLPDKADYPPIRN